jgi:protein tyrosine kinase modulator
MGTPQNYVSVTRRPPDIEDYLDILRRYRSWIVGPAFLGLVLGVVVAFLWPDTFVSTALMRITPQQVPEKLVPSAINVQMAERLTQMQQEILSRASLSELIQRLDLYKKDRQRLPMDDVVEKMRDAVKIPLLDVQTQGNNRPASAFMIQFRYSDRYKAQGVVQQLVSKFTEQSATVQRNQANLTANFLSDEARQAKENLDRLDAEITKYKNENQGRLPEQFQANVATLNSLQQQLGAVNETLNRNQQEKIILETQLQQLNTQLNFFTTNSQQNAASETVKNDRLVSLNKMILDAKSQLASMREIYTESWPDVRNFKARIADLEREQAELEKQENAAQNSSQAKPQKITNPQIVKSIEDTKSNMAILKAEIDAKEQDIKARQRQVADVNRAIASYQSRIEASPLSEQKYAALQREYQIAKETYDDLSKRREISETAQSLEERKAGENLEVLDTASLPEKPAEPQRLAIVGAGIAGGLILGFVLAGIKEMKDTSLKNLKDVRAYTNLPVLSSIPLLENALLVRRKRRLAWLAWSSAVILGTVAMSGSMYFYYFGRT